MDRCPQCDCRLRLADDLCPHCLDSSGLQARDTLLTEREVEAAASLPDPLMAIARMANGAEAGYFADELSRATGVDVEVVARERFDGVHAVWSVDYVLMAPRDEAERVAQSLQELVDRSDDRDEGSLENPSRGELATGVWAPLILTLAAGSIACWGVERFDQRPRVRPPALVDRNPRQPADLWQVLGATPGIWVQKSPDGSLTRELALDPEHQTAVLREDRNGDGDYEREWELDWKRR